MRQNDNKENAFLFRNIQAVKVFVSENNIPNSISNFENRILKKV